MPPTHMYDIQGNVFAIQKPSHDGIEHFCTIGTVTWSDPTRTKTVCSSDYYTDSSSTSRSCDMTCRDENPSFDYGVPVSRSRKCNCKKKYSVCETPSHVVNKTCSLAQCNIRGRYIDAYVNGSGQCKCCK